MRVNGDELRRLALPAGRGYLASDVDELLLRVADEIDAGRPVGGLVSNAVLRLPEPVRLNPQLFRRRPLTYQATAVHWLLQQLRRYDNDWDRARMAAHPWRSLAAWDFSERRADAGPSGTAAGFSAAGVCEGLPGMRLRWRVSKSAWLGTFFQTQQGGG